MVILKRNNIILKTNQHVLEMRSALKQQQQVVENK